jgi:peptidoglycan/xylan/chitin deacetylase (PgdA/CDA1 family)
MSITREGGAINRSTKPNLWKPSRYFYIGIALLVAALVVVTWMLPAFVHAEEATTTTTVTPTTMIPPVTYTPPPLPHFHFRAGTNVSRLPTSRKLVALTFDDAWGANPTYQKYVASILDTLKAAEVHATFFPTAKSIGDTADLVQRLMAEGNDIGSHGYTHRKLTSLHTAQVYEQIRGARLAFAKLGIVPKPLYRTPYGSWNKPVLGILKECGYVNFLWSLNANDADYGMTAAKCSDRVVYRTVPGTIILMHVQNPITPAALPSIIRRLQARGYRFVLLREVL